MTLKYQIIYKKLDPFNIAYIEDGNIYMEPFLKKNRSLFLRLRKHEEKHLVEKNFIKDYKEDLRHSKFTLEDTLFILKHKHFFWMSPFVFLWYNGKNISFDSSRFINFVMLSLLIVVGILLI
jgi:hypothetical protein